MISSCTLTSWVHVYISKFTGGPLEVSYDSFTSNESESERESDVKFCSPVFDVKGAITTARILSAKDIAFTFALAFVSV